nr:MAG TPA: Ead/Ea22-like protein [Caudoviricetes sp.]
MTDITELAQRLKAAAKKATPGRIGDRIDGSGSIKYRCFGNDGSLVLQADHKNMEYGFIGPNGEADELFFRECKPENILALVEALEKAQQRNGELETYSKTAIEFREAARDENQHLKLELEIAEKRIAELESRTVKLPEPFKLAKSSSGLTYYYADEVDAAITSAGIKVEAE